MEARGCSEAFVPRIQTTQQYFPEDIDLNADSCEDFTLTMFSDYEVTQSSEFCLCKQCAAHEGEVGIKVGKTLYSYTASSAYAKYEILLV
jgi:hypothetical protein